MKNLHLLPTEKPSRLIIQNGNRLILGVLDYSIIENRQHIYITCDEEIKDECWIMPIDGIPYKLVDLDCILHSDRKIILTTDADLIEDGLQAIDDEFLEWFVKNPNCKEIEIKKQYLTPLGDVVGTCYDNERLNYEIIIPQEEPKQDSTLKNAKLALREYLLTNKEKVTKDLQEMREKSGTSKDETLEEAAARYFKKVSPNVCFYDAVKFGAKWQAERSYRKEEVLQIYKEYEAYVIKTPITEVIEFSKWFEQFKKK